MQVTIRLAAGPHHSAPTKRDVQKNIDALQRCVDNRKVVADDVLLFDTMSILKAIQEKLASA